MSHDSSDLDIATTPLVSLGAVSAEQGLDDLNHKLHAIRGWLAGDLYEVERELGSLGELARAPNLERDLAARAAAHLLDLPGKRIRPLCLLLGAELANVADHGRARDLAVACELVHAATLLHDDVIDEGSERRGAPTARVVFGNSASILAGDYLLVEALERVERAQARHPGTPLLSSLLGTIAQMVAAEALQLERRGKPNTSRAMYLSIIDGKTASLFRWALTAGASIGDASPAEIGALAAAGVALGRAFQMVDDVLDVEGDADAVGKDLLADLAQGKATLPLILAAEIDPGVVHDLVNIGEPGAAARLVERMRQLGAIGQARQSALEQAREARLRLGSLRDCPARGALEYVVEAAVRRCW